MKFTSFLKKRNKRKGFVFVLEHERLYLNKIEIVSSFLTKLRKEQNPLDESSCIFLALATQRAKL